MMLIIRRHILCLYHQPLIVTFENIIYFNATSFLPLDAQMPPMLLPETFNHARGLMICLRAHNSPVATVRYDEPAMGHGPMKYNTPIAPRVRRRDYAQFRGHFHYRAVILLLEDDNGAECHHAEKAHQRARTRPPSHASRRTHSHFSPYYSYARLRCRSLRK